MTDKAEPISFYETVYVLMEENEEGTAFVPAQNLLGHVLMFSRLESAKIRLEKMADKDDMKIQEFHMQLIPVAPDAGEDSTPDEDE